MKTKILLAVAVLLGMVSCSTSVYEHPAVDAAPVFPGSRAVQKKARNVVLMIGDGMGAEHVWAAWLSNKGKLNITTLPVTGFSITTSASHTVTDSAAGGTAIACGCKTRNGQLGIDADGGHLESLAEKMRKAGKSTGIVVTKSVTDATPAAFYAHVKSRHDTSAIAGALVDAGFEVVAGGGEGDFTPAQRDKLAASSQLFELAAAGDCEPAGKRGAWLPLTVQKALQILEKDKDGFFLMVEGSRIDLSAHVNDLPETVRETLDFDKAVGVVLEWMRTHPDTLLVVTADHQTGGLSLLNGDKAAGSVKAHFSTFRHSGVSVPVYAAGCGAQSFTGVQDNSELAGKILQAAQLPASRVRVK
jgi:alkaline phosphatase